jgi:hypothetical protein
LRHTFEGQSAVSCQVDDVCRCHLLKSSRVVATIF